MSFYRFRQSALTILAMFFAVSGSLALAEDHGHADAPAAAAEGDALSNLLFPEHPNYDHPPIQPDPKMFLWTLILFGGFVLVMRSQAWNPLIAGLDKREARVVQAERDAEAARKEVVELRQQSEARLAEVQEQVKELIGKARAEAESQKREITAKAEAEAQRIKDEALSEIEAAHAAAMASLDEAVESQVSLATQQIVGRSL